MPGGNLIRNVDELTSSESELCEAESNLPSPLTVNNDYVYADLLEDAAPDLPASLSPPKQIQHPSHPKSDEEEEKKEAADVDREENQVVVNSIPNAVLSNGRVD